MSVKELYDEKLYDEGTLNEFGKCVQEIEETMGRLQDLARLVRSGEISKETAEPMKSDYMQRLFGHAERFFKLEDALEGERARIRIELEKYKRETDRYGGGERADQVSKLERRLGSIDDVFRSVNLQVELMTARYYIMFLNSAMQKGEMKKEDFDRQRELSKHFLDSVAERWTYQKKELTSSISGLEPERDEINAELDELRVRYLVGEISQSDYNSRRSKLEDRLKSIDGNIERFTKYIDAVDTRVFECYFLYTQPNPEISFDYESIIPPEPLPKITELSGKIRVGDELLTPQELYDRTLYFYSLIWGMGSASTKSNLEKDIRKLMAQGLTREEALVRLNESVRGKTAR
jgi:hypothetical protein